MSTEQELENNSELQSQTSVEPASTQADEQPKSLREELATQFKIAAERSRDEQGRFAKAGSASGGDRAAEAGADRAVRANEAKPAVSTPNTEQPAAEAPKHTAPTSWAAEAKAEFDKLPAAVQAAIAKRETEVHQGFTKLDEDRGLGKQIKEAVTPYMAVIQAEGGNPVSAFKVFLNTAYQLRTAAPETKIALVRQLCQQYNIPVEGLTQPTPSGQQPSPSVPQPHAQGMTQDQVAEIIRQERLQSEIAAFASDPANRHFSLVRPRMAELLTSGEATSLKDAYDKACDENPYVRSSLELERLRSEQDKRQTELASRAAAAKHAGGSVTGAPGASTPSGRTPQNRDLREELRAQFRAAQGAV